MGGLADVAGLADVGGLADVDGLAGVDGVDIAAPAAETVSVSVADSRPVDWDEPEAPGGAAWLLQPVVRATVSSSTAAAGGSLLRLFCQFIEGRTFLSGRNNTAL
ncbi:hypothetical protein GCM10023194_30470 [Planotetraspora phitsanulokensis]|uniref:Uncharacterized protein n=1 Tax=Planotetraspora phitsanulokensis TaxID=575192 RepID=A0A8J3U000_9ACTN|nr:hypothetical protein Pph01_08180 [Planotetraspora phitsanulokensis]